MEKELVPEEKQAHFIETLEKVMLEKPDNWKKHYHGDENSLHFAENIASPIATVTTSDFQKS